MIRPAGGTHEGLKLIADAADGDFPTKLDRPVAPMRRVLVNIKFAEY